MNRKLGGFTLICRLICILLAAAPVLYWSFVTKGDAYHFLALVLLAPVAGIFLIANSLFCLLRYRHIESPWISLVFMVIGALGIYQAWYFLPQFRM